MQTLRQQLSDQNGNINPIAFTYTFHISMLQLYDLINIQHHEYDEQDRLSAKETQYRLHQLVDILSLLIPSCGSCLDAYQWYKTHCVPGYGGRSAYDLVKVGRADVVIRYIEQHISQRPALHASESISIH